MTPASAPRAAPAELPFYSRYTYGLHLRAEMLNNVFGAIIGLAGIVARKGLGAGEIGITILTTAGSAANLTAIFWSHTMEGRAKRPFIVASALLGRLTLVLMAFATTSPFFIALCVLYYFSEPIFIPAQNAMLQANYSGRIRGHVFGTITGLTKVTYLVAAIGGGLMLRWQPQSYLWMFPSAGVLGTIAYLLYAKIRIRRWDSPATTTRRAGLFGAVREFFRILRNDRDFDRFERNFMFYGMAFMIVQPVHVYLLVDELRMDYLTYTACQLVMVQIVIAFVSRRAGRLLDRVGPTRLASLSFAVLVTYVATLAAAATFHSIPLAFAGFFLFGVGMSGVNAAWSLGAMQFAGDRDASAYMGAHVACVGVRGLFGPAIGSVIVLGMGHPRVDLEKWGIPAVYVLSALLFALGSVSMARLHRKIGAGKT
ncbi:MAG: MFS transporter [Planctomycetes bacterium]|nr:MFS transporter [Planctomycetota bacterium]